MKFHSVSGSVSMSGAEADLGSVSDVENEQRNVDAFNMSDSQRSSAKQTVSSSLRPFMERGRGRERERERERETERERGGTSETESSEREQRFFQ